MQASAHSWSRSCRGSSAASTGSSPRLRRIGINEKSRGNGAGKYLVIVTGYDAWRVVWWTRP